VIRAFMEDRAEDWRNFEQVRPAFEKK